MRERNILEPHTGAGIGALKRMKRKVQLKGQLRRYVQWPLILSVLLLVMNLVMYFVSVKAGCVMSGFLIVYIAVVLLLYVKNRPQIYGELVSFATQYGQVQRKLLKELAIPYALLDEDGRVLWGNTAFFAASGKGKKNLRKSITWFFPEFTLEMLPESDFEDSRTVHFSYGEKDYRADLRRVYMDHVMDSSTFVEVEEDEGFLIAVYLFDETEMNRYIRMIREQRLVAGLVYLDNYEEALETVEEVRRSLLVALVDRKINKYIGALGGIVKKDGKRQVFHSDSGKGSACHAGEQI